MSNYAAIRLSTFPDFAIESPARRDRDLRESSFQLAEALKSFPIVLTIRLQRARAGAIARV